MKMIIKKWKREREDILHSMFILAGRIDDFSIFDLRKKREKDEKNLLSEWRGETMAISYFSPCILFSNAHVYLFLVNISRIFTSLFFLFSFWN